MMRFRETWGMLKEDPDDTCTIIERFEVMLMGRVSDWKPTNRREKDRTETFPWFIACRKSEWEAMQ
jgi:hypothetical protein